jgi:hypothetical protein
MTESRTNPGEPISNLSVATIIETDGPHIVAELDTGIAELTRVYAGDIYPIGQFGSIVKIHYGRRIIYAYVSRLRMKAEYEMEQGVGPVASSTARIIEADLFGEGDWVRVKDTWELRFERGVSEYPLPQQKVYLTPHSELKYIYSGAQGCTIEIGEHVGTGGTPCHADLNALVGKHTAVLGSTGAGKSATVAAVLHSILERGSVKGYKHWSPQVVVLDPHNEYGTAFKSHSRLSTDNGTLSLPYWLLDFAESVSLFIGRTEFAATSQSNILLNALLEARRAGAEVIKVSADAITVDSPVAYLLGDPNGLDIFGKRDGKDDHVGLVGAINKQRPRNENKKDHEDYNKVIRKIQTLRSDARMAFMMEPWSGSVDEFTGVVRQFLGAKDPMQIVDLSGVPNEVAGIASAAIARTLFSVKVWQTPDERESSPVLIVCEEAHRYVPDRGEAVYAAAQEAIRRVAKEGRKYGLGLMLVSQRPSEVEATVLSQCNSWIVMRVTNEQDREHVKNVLPDSMSGLVKMLSGLRRREAVFVGEAAMLPSRIMVRELPEDKLPRSHDVNFDAGWQNEPMTEAAITAVGLRWRTQKRT